MKMGLLILVAQIITPMTGMIAQVCKNTREVQERRRGSTLEIVFSTFRVLFFVCLGHHPSHWDDKLGIQDDTTCHPTSSQGQAKACNSRRQTVITQLFLELLEFELRTTTNQLLFQRHVKAKLQSEWIQESQKLAESDSESTLPKVSQLTKRTEMVAPCFRLFTAFNMFVIPCLLQWCQNQQFHKENHFHLPTD